MKKQKLSVTGLANIGRLLERAESAVPEPLKSTENKLTRESIIDRTVERLVTSGDYASQDAYAAADARARKLVTAAVRDAWQTAHAEALAQSNAVDVLLERQYASRTMHITPAIVASVMEQLGLSNMVLDMRLVGTVFERNALDFSVADLGDRQVVDYTMAPIEGADTIVAQHMAEVNAPTAQRAKDLANVKAANIVAAEAVAIEAKKPRVRKPKLPLGTEPFDDAPVKKPRAPRKAKLPPPVNVDPSDLL